MIHIKNRRNFMVSKQKYTETVYVIFQPDTLADLNEITNELEISNSEFIRELVEDALNEGTD
jgi:hypothetical protein